MTKSNSSISDRIKSLNSSEFKKLCYAYSSSFEHSCILDSCEQQSGIYEGKYELLAAFGAKRILTSLEAVQHATDQKEWIFGVIGYDIKNHFERLSSNNPFFIDQEDTALFVPEIVMGMDRAGQIKELKGRVTDSFFDPKISSYTCEGLHKVNRIEQQSYVQKIKEIKELILDGEVYELNYCVQHQYQYTAFSPLAFYQKLIERSPVPMASYFKWQGQHLCGASMERYLAKTEDQLISQPIKGTIRKGKNTEEDEQLKISLFQSEKDRAENVMIVDLVRNDLAKICEAGSIQVDELFGIYSYLQLHQMISTISGKHTTGNFTDILRATFPMGSMTGAPKIAAMKHIEQLEEFKRSWYSGCLGYIQPNGDFDFNVVIRSLICDENTKRIAYSAGGAITIDSVPEGEWHECLLKTKAIEHVLID